MSGLQLRDYQIEAVDAVEEAAQRGVRRPLVVLPTGTGKTVVFAELIRRRPGRGLILAHREELLEQARDKVRLVIPDADVGVVKAERDEHERPIVVASVQTLARERRVRRLGREFGTIVVDEAHHAAAASYRRILAQLGGFEQEGPAVVLGVTATPERADKVGLDRIWEEIVYRRDILDMVRLGYLCDLRALRVRLDVDLDEMATRAGDYDEGELSDAMARADAPEHAVEAYRRHGEGRKTLVFTPSVELAYEMAGAFSAAGFPAAAVDGAVSADDRAAILARFRAGEIKVLANCALLTEGYDEPGVSCLILARPTKSRPLYMQMVGRGTRRAPDKTDCLVIDLVGSTQRHDLVTLSGLFGLDPERLDGKRVGEALGEGDGVREAPPPEGELVVEQVELFANREFHWSCGNGLYILPGGDHGQVVLRQAGEGWTVTEMRAGGGGQTLADALDLGYAQGLAEDTVRRWGARSLARADAPWRAQPASYAQLQALRGNGLTPTEGMTKGEASDLLSVAKAASALGPATQRQRDYLQQLGVDVPDALTKSEASALIDRARKGARK